MLGILPSLVLTTLAFAAAQAPAEPPAEAISQQCLDALIKRTLDTDPDNQPLMRRLTFTEGKPSVTLWSSPPIPRSSIFSTLLPTPIGASNIFSETENSRRRRQCLLPPAQGEWLAGLSTARTCNGTCTITFGDLPRTARLVGSAA